MRLISELGTSKTEEDVKDAYIKALGLKKYTKGLIDIQTEEIWFEAKEAATPPVLMIAQLLFYVRDARKKGERIPPFLAVIDREKAAIMETAKALPILADRSIKWPKSASAVDKSVAAQAAPYIETHFVVFKIESHEQEFVTAVKAAIKAGKFVRTPITPDNLRQVFDKWVEMVGSEIDGVEEADYALLFFADVMHDGTKAAMANLPARLLHEGDRPLFLLGGKTYELGSDKGYRNFWAIYHRPPGAAAWRHSPAPRRAGRRLRQASHAHSPPAAARGPAGWPGCASGCAPHRRPAPRARPPGTAALAPVMPPRRRDGTHLQPCVVLAVDRSVGTHGFFFGAALGRSRARWGRDAKRASGVSPARD